MNYYTMACGCRLPMLDSRSKDIDGLPSIELDFYKINKNCGHAWGIIDRGLTKGVFQLEKALGQTWAHKIQPLSISELSAVISLIRPGTLEARITTDIGEKNLTQLYVDRRNGIEPITYVDPAVEGVLEETLGILVYQEQAMKIATRVAGFSEQDADSLRKAMGKKDAKVMSKVKGMFLEGVEKQGIISKEAGDQLFDWIEKSQRYSFNKSHAVSYAYMGYWSAYVKAHFPLHFYTSWLNFADKKQKPQIEFAELVRDSRQMGVDIIVPSIVDISYNPKIIGQSVGIGLRNLKQAGEKKVVALIETINRAELLVNKDIRDFNWYEILFHVCDSLNKVLVENIICAGLMDDYGQTRQRMLYDYKYWKMLTSKQKSWIKDYGSTRISLAENIDNMIAGKGVRIQKKNGEKLRDIINLLENPTNPCEDTIDWTARKEQELYGISLSCHRTQAYEKTRANCTVQDFNDGTETSQNIIIAAEINQVRFWSPKDDATKRTCYLTIEDETGGTPNVVIYNNNVDELEHRIYEGNLVYLIGYRNKKRTEQFVVNKLEQL